MRSGFGLWYENKKDIAVLLTNESYGVFVKKNLNDCFCLLFATAFGLGLAGLPPLVAQEATLKEAASELFGIGVGVGDKVTKTQEESSLLVSQFSSVTPANFLKSSRIHREEDKFVFTEVDRFVAFAKSNGLDVVGHCLISARDDQTPKWWQDVGGVPASKEKLLGSMKAYIDTVVKRYAKDVAIWDVVNEALDDGQQGYLRDSIWTRTSGEEFIVKAFQYTHENDPDALLVYNDYNCEWNEKRDKTIKLLKSLLQKGAPVDALGMQCHFELDEIQFDNLELLFSELRKLGLKVVISELDIDVVPRSRWWADGGKYRDEISKIDPYKNGCPPEILARQADQYAQLFRLFKQNEDIVESVSFWNLHDGESWLNAFPWNRVNHPLLFDRNRKPKPAFHAVIDAMGNEGGG
jgi:GH35 family endo-1,4-beta-xylanase